MIITSAIAAETIVVLNPQGPTHSGTAQLLAVVEKANKNQNKYNFVVEFKPGAFESIALNELATAPQTKISTMTNAAVEGFDRGLVKDSDLIPIFSQGDSCWAVIGLTNNNQGLDSIKSYKEIVGGGPAIGGATHLAAIELGRRYNKPVRYIVYRSNYDAMINMVANDGVNFIFERVVNYDGFKNKNPNLQILAMSCPIRHPQAKNVKTLKEYGINSPYIWQQIVANKNINPAKAREFENIFATATQDLGQDAIFKISDQTPAMFQNITTTKHYQQSLSTIFAYRQRFLQEINSAR